MPFRFLDLPYELRIEVYRNLVVCDDSLKDIKVEDALENMMNHNHRYHLHPCMPTWNPIQVVHRMSTSILHVNRQICFEAQDVLHRGNQFIRVIGPTSTLHDAVQHHGVPILSMEPCTKNFRGVTLEIKVSNRAAHSRSYASNVSTSLLILGKHLPLLVEWLPEYHSNVPVSLATTNLTLSIARPTSTATQMSFLALFRSHAKICSRYVIDGPWDNQVAAIARQELGLGSNPPDLDLRFKRSKAFAADATKYEADGRSGLAFRYMALSVSHFRLYHRSSIGAEWYGRLAQLDFESLFRCATAIDRFWMKQPDEELRDASFDILAYHAIQMVRHYASILVKRQDRPYASPAYVFSQEQRKRLADMARMAESIKVAALEWEEATEEDFESRTRPYSSTSR